MADPRLEQQLRFVTEIDRLKRIERQTLLNDRSRRENDAEHSWHLAVMALLLGEYAEDPGLDLFRV
ncbi:MAG: HD domain-containing protein, partial [Armatimonadetes bacterium]|nr:HD domain-containing protein [Armatimonadota bacterium]